MRWYESKSDKVRTRQHYDTNAVIIAILEPMYLFNLIQFNFIYFQHSSTLSYYNNDDKVHIMYRKSGGLRTVLMNVVVIM